MEHRAGVVVPVAVTKTAGRLEQGGRSCGLTTSRRDQKDKQGKCGESFCRAPPPDSARSVGEGPWALAFSGLVPAVNITCPQQDGQSRNQPRFSPTSLSYEEERLYQERFFENELPTKSRVIANYRPENQKNTDKREKKKNKTKRTRCAGTWCPVSLPWPREQTARVRQQNAIRRTSKLFVINHTKTA